MRVQFIVDAFACGVSVKEIILHMTTSTFSRYDTVFEYTAPVERMDSKQNVGPIIAASDTLPKLVLCQNSVVFCLH
jgi:hypothetical protein